MAYSSLGNQSDRGKGLFKTMTKAKKTKVDKKPARPSTHVSEHGRYQVKAGLLAGKYVARAFARPPTETRGVIAEASGSTEDAAIAALHEIIDARETSRIEGRRKDPRTGMAVPSVEEYSEALGHVALTRPQKAMLTALSLADVDGLTEGQLASGAGYKSLTSTNRSFASAGRLIAKYLSLETNSKVQPVALEGISVVAFRGEPQNEADPGNWILYPELREAVIATF